MKQPKIRFKGFEGEWKEKNIASIAYLKAGKSVDTSQEISHPSNGYYPCYGGNGLRGFVRDYTHDGIYNIIGRQGALCGNVKLVSGKFHATEHAVVVSPTTPLDPYFLYNLLTKANINQYATGVAQPGISVQNVNKSLFLVLPDFAEQQTVGMYFKHLDTLIQSTTKKIESLKQVKAASLQSMFPQEGETTPRVRFKGFEGEWEEVSLGEETYPAGIKNHDNLPLESYSISNECGFIPQNVQFENGGTMATADKRMYYIVSKNSFGYNPARINVGSLGYYTGDDDVIVSSLYEIFKTSDRIFDTFLLCWFKTSTFQKLIEQYQEGGVRFYFFYDKLCMCHTLVPSYEEQKKIASYFTNLDFQISLQTQRLEKLKQIKSACLDNMFV